MVAPSKEPTLTLLSTGTTSLAALLTAAGAGDRQAFAELYAHSSAKLFGLVLRICRQRPLAEDVLQETFVKIWRFAASYRAEAAPPLTWMAAVARNTAIDAMRRRTELQFAVSEDGRSEEEQIADPATLQPTDALDMRALHRCLDRLDSEQKSAVTLAYIDGYSREELADRFQRPVGTIKTWLHRGLAKLKDCLDR